MRVRRVLGLAACAFLFGCSHDTGSGGGASSSGPVTAATIVGKWKMDKADELKDPPGTQPGFMKGFASTFWYEFKADKSFSGAMSEGTYSLSGSNLAITTTKLAGQDVHPTKPQMTGELSADGSILTLHPPAGPLLKMLPAELQHGIPMRKEGGS